MKFCGNWDQYLTRTIHTKVKFHESRFFSAASFFLGKTDFYRKLLLSSFLAFSPFFRSGFTQCRVFLSLQRRRKRTIRVNWTFGSQTMEIKKFTARKLREFASNFSEFYDLNQNLQLNNTLRTLRLKIIFAVLKNYPLVAKLQLKSERWLCSFQGIIRIAFGNEVPLTPKRISSLERSTFSFCFSKKA